MPVVRIGEDPAADDEGTDSPPARRDFTQWPLPVGRVETRDGLTFVHSVEPDGFSAADHRRIPDDRVELLDGVAVMRPDPTPTDQRTVIDLYARLCETCPGHLDPVLGPLDVRIGSATVFRPDIVVRPRGEDDTLPVLVVEVRPDRGSYYRWRERQGKSRGYRDAGVPSYWVVDPATSSVAVYELTYHKRGSYSTGEVCAKGQRNWWRLWSTKPA